MSVCLVAIGDGRHEYHRLSMASIDEMVSTWDAWVPIDDRDHTLGFSGAIAKAWERVLGTGCDYVFHCELDFTFNEWVPIDRMIGVLERHPEVVQLSLKRQPLNPAERAAGDFVAVLPDAYHEVREGDDVWLQHRVCFTTNPSLYRAEVCKLGWPQVKFSEGIFSAQYREANPDHWFGIWGARHDPPRVHHIGHERAGVGY